MKLLAYDTTSEVLSVALLENDRLVGEKELSFNRPSEALTGVISELLTDNRLTLKDIDVLAVGLGPGSFTGLRVGISTAKMLSYALGWKLAPVASTAALAMDVEGWSGAICVMLDGKKGLLYASFYEKNGNALKELKKPSLMTIKQVMAFAKNQTYFTGSGVALYKNELLGSKKGSFFSETQGLPKAKHIGALGLAIAKKKKFTHPFKLEPLYLHPKDCNAILPKRS